MEEGQDGEGRHAGRPLTPQPSLLVTGSCSSGQGVRGGGEGLPGCPEPGGRAQASEEGWFSGQGEGGGGRDHISGRRHGGVRGQVRPACSEGPEKQVLVAQGSGPHLAESAAAAWGGGQEAGSSICRPPLWPLPPRWPLPASPVPSGLQNLCLLGFMLEVGFHWKGTGVRQCHSHLKVLGSLPLRPSRTHLRIPGAAWACLRPSGKLPPRPAAPSLSRRPAETFAPA